MATMEKEIVKGPGVFDAESHVRRIVFEIPFSQSRDTYGIAAPSGLRFDFSDGGAISFHVETIDARYDRMIMTGRIGYWKVNASGAVHGTAQIKYDPLNRTGEAKITI